MEKIETVIEFNNDKCTISGMVENFSFMGIGDTVNDAKQNLFKNICLFVESSIKYRKKLPELFEHDFIVTFNDGSDCEPFYIR